MKNVARILREQVSRRSRNSLIVLAASVLAVCLFAGKASAQQPYPFCIPNYDALNCPCSNSPASFGSGCNNFGQFTGGATLTWAGTASLVPSQDTLLFISSAENNTSLSIFIQGTATYTSGGVVFGAGIRCVSGILKRMYTGAASSGTISRPGLFDPDVATRSANPPGPLDPLTSGDVRFYFVYYRDPNAAGPCGNPASTFNSTQAVAVTWY